MTNTTRPEPAPASLPLERLLYQIADESGVSIMRFTNESLAEFADRLKRELLDKLVELDDFVDEIEAIDIDDDAEEDA